MMEMSLKKYFTVWNIWKKSTQCRVQISKLLNFLQQAKKTTFFKLLTPFKYKQQTKTKQTLISPEVWGTSYVL